jgi:hypothetical protein
MIDKTPEGHPNSADVLSGHLWYEGVHKSIVKVAPCFGFANSNV